MPSRFGGQFNKVVRAQRLSTEGNTVVAAVSFRNDYNQRLQIFGLEAGVSADVLEDIGNVAQLLVYAREYQQLTPSDNHATLFAADAVYDLLIAEPVTANFHAIHRRFDVPLELIQPTTYVFAVHFINLGNPPPPAPADDWELRIQVYGRQVTGQETEFPYRFR